MGPWGGEADEDGYRYQICSFLPFNHNIFFVKIKCFTCLSHFWFKALWFHGTSLFLERKISLCSPEWSSHLQWMNHISWWHLWVCIVKFIQWWGTQVHHGCRCPPSPPCPPPPHLLALPVCAHPRAGRQKTWQPKSNRKKREKKGLTWQRAPPWQFNRRAFFGTSLSLHVCPSLCKCHRQSRNAKLLCFPGCLLSCSSTKGDIYINAVPMSVTQEGPHVPRYALALEDRSVPLNKQISAITCDSTRVV